MSESEELLIKRALKGDIDAFESIVYKYEKMIYSLAYRMLNNREDASDITQEVFVKLFKALDKVAERPNLKAWLYTVCYNTAIDEIRRKKGKETLSADAPMNDNEESFVQSLKADEPSPEEKMLKKEKSEILIRAINQLNEKHKRLIILRDINSLSYNEIAEITNQSLGTVKSGISRARRSLRDILEQTGELKYF